MVRARAMGFLNLLEEEEGLKGTNPAVVLVGLWRAGKKRTRAAGIG